MARIPRELFLDPLDTVELTSYLKADTPKCKKYVAVALKGHDSEVNLFFRDEQHMAEFAYRLIDISNKLYRVPTLEDRIAVDSTVSELLGG